jgi:hypothetical protein
MPSQAVTELHGNFAVGWLDGRVCLGAVEAVHRFWPKNSQYTYTTGFRWFITHCVHSTESIYQLSYLTERVQFDGAMEGYCCVAMSWKGIAMFIGNNEVKFTTSTDKLSPSGCTAMGGKSRRNTVNGPIKQRDVVCGPDFVYFFDSSLSFSQHGGDGSASRNFACGT